MDFINKENRKYFPPQKLLTLESGSFHSTVFGSLVFQKKRASARLQKKKKITGKLQLSFQRELSALPPALTVSASGMWQS